MTAFEIFAYSNSYILQQDKKNTSTWSNFMVFAPGYSCPLKQNIRKLSWSCDKLISWKLISWKVDLVRVDLVAIDLMIEKWSHDTGSVLWAMESDCEICEQKATLFCTDCCESCSNLNHKNPRRKGHSLKPITETDPKTQDTPETPLSQGCGISKQGMYYNLNLYGIHGRQ